jgi:hypothetical protein
VIAFARIEQFAACLAETQNRATRAPEERNASSNQKTEKKEMNGIEFSGRSQGKGRHGYFRLYGAQTTHIPSDPDAQVLHLDFYPKRRVNCVGPLRLLLTIEDATALEDFIRRALAQMHPPPRIEQGELVCDCAIRGIPRLEESGYQVRHKLVAISGDRVTARGWNGSSRNVSEDGDTYWLICDSCGKTYALPAEVGIDWV